MFRLRNSLLRNKYSYSSNILKRTFFNIPTGNGSNNLRPVYNRFDGSHQQGNGDGANFTQLLFDPSSRKYLAIIFGGGGLFYVTHLDEAPVSHRKRFIWLPRILELKIGEYTYNRVLQETGQSLLPANHPLTLKVERIFRRLVDAAISDPQNANVRDLIKDVNWKIHIVNDPRMPPNAFVLPGGKVFVFSSILGICQNDNGLATVLSHEFAHQLARHTAENLSKLPVYTLMGLTLYSITGSSYFNRLILDAAIRMPASRQMETEADYIGLMIMSRACFDPRESVNLWKRMENFEKTQMKGGMPLEFLSTHPSSDRRMENMKEWLPKAISIYEQSDCNAFRNVLTRGGFPTLFV
ncbi:related to Mitochondrial metalloendopeptidase OMA1 [Saccharomycodes ludwigii]|uniref:Related to Mitochondrial metalloendopeptidase OMA1 n=1 Tax=Saccharomycodes ludwigii TaxID=36035 RepID=A0A376B491_9ASCO|nr:hypothetical protein SCDLUD_005284 [Saccharomycodes ludwigii]KAH3898937.1 hypothetical protein SCDLUD_005284 [Saccharomycodes ludwigii]SSD59399.1 related to Mitochondrial metalloendopeptidase OMA1 [Saccharomycodes ludwigii]